MMQNQNEYTCGFGQWRPRFLQKFASMKFFMVVYGLLGTTQAMSFVYFIATLTTLEKRFQIRSEITGILMSGNELSQIFLSVILAYKGGKGNRPVWIAWGVLFSSLSCFILALPHFVYGPGTKALALTEEFIDYKLINLTLPASQDVNSTLCFQRKEEKQEGCREENMENQLLSLCLIFFSQFVLGVGTTLYVTLGQPYLDDNTKRKNTPKLLGMTMALRSVGPAGGFVLGFFCLNFYIDPSLTPIIDSSDPRWLGAWWLGWIILGSVMTAFSFLIASFPRQMKPSSKNLQMTNKYSYESVPTKSSLDATKQISCEINMSKDQCKQNEEAGLLTDFKRALLRVCTNPLLIFNNFTAVFYILGASGYINFYTKYAEVQYHQSAAFSSMIAGVSTVISIVLGFLISGFAISKFKPKESYLLLFNIFIAAGYMAGELSFLFLNCDNINTEIDSTVDYALKKNLHCNAECSCDYVNYSPVCFEEEKQSFFSPCHAGCSLLQDEAKGIYSNCSCLPEATDSVKRGPCKVNCTSMFIVFVIVQCLIQMIGCSGRITNVLINYRAVEPRDKPLAQGICLFMISLLAFIPGPIIYGKVIDSTCLIWDNTCGNKGNCWVYDKHAFRINLNLTALGMTFGALICDIVVWYLGRNIKLYEEERTG